MPNDESVLKAARAIRPELKKLISENAEELDQQLAGLLEAAEQGELVTNRILQDLRGAPATREWLKKFLKEEEMATTRNVRFEPPLGDPGVIGATKYVCPRGDYTWYQMSAGSTVPKCPTHAVTLVVSES